MLEALGGTVDHGVLFDVVKGPVGRVDRQNPGLGVVRVSPGNGQRDFGFLAAPSLQGRQGGHKES